MTRVAVLVADTFEENELFYPYFRLQEEGFHVDLIGAEGDVAYKGKHGITAVSDYASKEVSVEDYDGVIIPGGYSPDQMRQCPETVQFVKGMNDKNKTIAAICHGPWMMISSCDLSGRTLTGFFSIKDDIVNAGAKYVDQEIMVDGNFITSRTPKDLPAFGKAIVESLK
ncbi:type 1 glutamine amidotransferase domain-containing protein [Serpentinicella sp. ANB-PHB4]|uniref:type 1 glutamine amidotransferase domain-containing protein n=1 Tax=Serpentinicella sp. ANB-PHB4 TaxID=3074076 RepID=UPI0028675C3D|nr:type 1 glutamine amidotransferase domain-containing protein [Serpentinicella sp. ANB-PHB4]MDR5658383.1 type 1 glutamine amidotransferase domain-containing protein [Serpentinicella sp. ANB-PHB4]